MNNTRAFRAVALAVAPLLVVPTAFAFDSGSTGADGALAPTVNTEIQLPPSGVLNYTSINIPKGVAVKFRKNALNTPAYLLVSGNVTIAGTIEIRGGDAAHSGTYGDGSLADDGIPGVGGPGGYDGGRGGRDDVAQRPEVIRGGMGLGPGGGRGGIEGSNGCTNNRYYKSAGMGAAYGTNGGATGFFPGHCNAYSPDQAKAYGSPLLQPLVGGSGGGGGRGGINFAGSGGGGGGGALLIAASGTFNLTGSVDATGGDSGGTSGTNGGDRGGGGSGGAIRVVATTVSGNGSLVANGGCTNYNNTRRQDCLDGSFNGAGGAPGRIRIEGETITFSGFSSPAYVGDTPGPVFLASIPALRIDTVAGAGVPATPTGSADVVLPADVANPVTVTFQTTNVPTGNTVLLKVVPAYGNPIEVLSPAITGTTAAGTASVQVALPQGPSVLQATTTYTVVVAQGEALSRFAGNERVERVQLIATLGERGEAQARLITVSGKAYTVPAAVLQLAGITG